MQAVAGDRLHFQSRTVGVAEHTALILEIRGDNGEPPYLVRHQNGHEAVVFPGVDAWVEHQADVDSNDG